MTSARWRRSAGALCLAITAFLGVPAGVRAQERRVGLADVDASVADALTQALEPWGVVVVPLSAPVEAEGPGATMPRSAERSRALAIAAGAVAVVWMSEAADGWTVWVYDLADERVLARALSSGPPFDEPTASALALTIVALLRHGAAAPEAERVREPLALSPEPTPASASAATPEPVPASAATTDPVPAPEPAPAPEGPRDEGRIELGAGVASFATTPLAAEPRLALAASFAPAATGGALGVGLVVRSGTGIGLSSARLSAHLYDVQILARVAGTFSLTGPLLFGVGADVGVRVTVLDARPAAAARTEIIRVVGLASGWLALGLDFGAVALWLRAGALATPWPQAYLVSGAQELTTEPVWAFAELALEVALR